MNLKDKTAGVILAGGKATRMNGIDKGLIKVNGATIVENHVKLIAPFVSESMIIANNQSYDNFELPVYADLIPDAGPMGGIYTAFQKTDKEYLLVLACDMPSITQSFLAYLLKEAGMGIHDVVVPEYNNKLQPLCAVYSRQMLPTVESFIKKNNYSLKEMIKATEHSTIRVDDDNPFSDKPLFTNLNSERELQKFLKSSENGS